MNNTLKREIILHILKSIGVFADQNTMRISMMEKLNSDKFLLNKKLAFETEDGKAQESKLYAATAKMENSEIKIMIADISDELQEVAVIAQMDMLAPYAFRLSEDQEDFGSMHLNVSADNWIQAPVIQQAKLLVGFESLLGLFLEWEKPTEYAGLYTAMVGFLNFYEGNE